MQVFYVKTLKSAFEVLFLKVSSTKNHKFRKCSLVSIIWWFSLMMMMNCLVVWLTHERHLALFLAGNIARDPHHRESPTCHVQDLNLHRTWVQACWISLCSIGNHYTMAPQNMMFVKTWCSIFWDNLVFVF